MAVAEAETAEINLPEWTDYQKKNGLDPLGMQNSSINLYQTFLPGISNVTLRMRYYGFYAWLCRTYAQRIGSTNPEDWKRFIRRAEALYALIAYKRGGETGVAGIEWAQKTLDANDAGPIDFATAAEPGSETYYLKQTWGIYGLAYRSQLFEIGILAVSPEHEIPLPSADIGEPLAEPCRRADRAAVGATHTGLRRGALGVSRQNAGELVGVSRTASVIGQSVLG